MKLGGFPPFSFLKSIHWVKSVSNCHITAKWFVPNIIFQGVFQRPPEDHVVQKEGNHVSYAMVPVWILTTRYKGVPYTFMMNGQTGKIVGSLPYDNAKSFLYMGITSLVLLPIFYFLLRFFM